MNTRQNARKRHTHTHKIDKWKQRQRIERFLSPFTTKRCFWNGKEKKKMFTSFDCWICCFFTSSETGCVLFLILFYSVSVAYGYFPWISQVTTTFSKTIDCIFQIVSKLFERVFLSYTISLCVSCPLRMIVVRLLCLSFHTFFLCFSYWSNKKHKLNQTARKPLVQTKTHVSGAFMSKDKLFEWLCLVTLEMSQ